MAFSNLLTTATCRAQHEWGGRSKTAALASMNSQNQRGWLAGRQHWDQDGCRHSSLMDSARAQHLQGFVPSRGTGCSHPVKTIEGVLFYSALCLPAACTPHAEGAVCASAPHLGTSQLGPCSVPSPGTVWHRALKPPWTLWVGTAPAAPVAVLALCCGSCPQTGGLQPAGGTGDKGGHGEGDGGRTQSIHKAPNSSWGN